MHVIVLNLTGDQIDSSFSLAAEMIGATRGTTVIGWKNGAPLSVYNPLNTQKIAIPMISLKISELLNGFTLDQVTSLGFIVIGGNEEMKRWIAYQCGRWNITTVFWYEKAQNIFLNQTIIPGENDPILVIFQD
jgi:hypothetical protein